MGLGPHSTSLLDRTGYPPCVWDTPFSMMLEQQDRQEQRRAKAMWWAMRHKKAKPLAPVEAHPKLKGKPRMWRWCGETIQSKSLFVDFDYTAEAIRKAGFKLPKIGGEK